MPKCSRLVASSHMVMFRCQLVVERSVSSLDFYDYNFEGRTIHQILIHQAWECVFSWIGQPYTLLVQKSYSALQEVDIDTDKWKAIICGVQVRILQTSCLITWAFRGDWAYPTVEPSVIMPSRDILQLMMIEYQYLIQRQCCRNLLMEIKSPF